MTSAADLPEPENLREAEQQAVEFHGRVASDADEIWVDGLNLFQHATDAYQGYKPRDAREMVMIGLFTAAWNSLYCARELALRSYYPQSLNLMRLPLECWMSYVYLLTFPERIDEFTDETKKAPKWNDMVQRIEGAEKERQDVAREWIDRLHQFSHIDQLVLRAVMAERDGGLVYRLGPDPIELSFRFSTAEAISVIAAQLQALDNFLRLIGLAAVADLPAYLNKVAAWQHAQAVKFPDAAAEFQEVSPKP